MATTIRLVTSVTISLFQSLSCVRLFATPWTASYHASLSITDSWTFLKLMPIELVMTSTHLILCRSLLLLLSILPSIRVFSNESALPIRQPKYWSFSFSISPSNEHSRLIYFRMDWLNLLAVQGTLKRLLQYHSSKESILSPYKVIKILFTIFSMLYIQVPFFAILIEWYPLPCLLDCWPILLLHLMYCWFPLVYFSLQIL